MAAKKGPGRPQKYKNDAERIAAMKKSAAEWRKTRRNITVPADVQDKLEHSRRALSEKLGIGSLTIAQTLQYMIEHTDYD